MTLFFSAKISLIRDFDALGCINCDLFRSNRRSKSYQRTLKYIDMTNELNDLYTFGAFRLDVQNEALWRGDDRVQLSPKEFELLSILVINQGNTVSKEEIFKQVWKDTFVENGVLTQNIYTLRNTLGKTLDGDNIIENVPRRGYRIAVPIVTKTPLKNKEGIAESPLKGFSKPTWVAISILSITFVSILGALFYRYLDSGDTRNSKSDTVADRLSFSRLTDRGDVNFLRISPDGKWLVYSNEDGLFLKDISLDTEIQLKVDGFKDFGSVQLSGDSSQLFFRSPESSFVAGKIYQTTRLGGAAKEIASDVWSGFSISNDGKKLAFSRVTPSKAEHFLVVKDLETGQEKTFSSKKQPDEFYPRNFPAWSSDDKKIASVFVTRTEHFAKLVVTNVETGKDEIITTTDFQNVEQVVWTRDDQALLASASDGSNFQIWKIGYPNGNTSQITQDLNDYLGLSITSDGETLLARQRKYFSNIWVNEVGMTSNFNQITKGTAKNEGLKGLVWVGNKQIVYTANYEKLRDWNLWKIADDGGSRMQITADESTQNEYPAVTTDLNSIYYSSAKKGKSRILRTGLDGSASSVISEGESQTGFFPQVSSDGKSLYYIKKSADSAAIWKYTLDSGDDEKLTDEKILSPINFLSISPDGSRLATQQLAKNSSGTKRQGYFDICVISTENPAETDFYKINSSQPFAQFSPDGKSLDFVKNTPNVANLWRLPLEPDSKPEIILSINNQRLYKFAWSKDGSRLALSRGNLVRDAVTIRGF